MSEQEKSAAQQRIDNAVYGTPKTNPMNSENISEHSVNASV